MMRFALFHYLIFNVHTVKCAWNVSIHQGLKEVKERGAIAGNIHEVSS